MSRLIENNRQMNFIIKNEMPNGSVPTSKLKLPNFSYFIRKKKPKISPVFSAYWKFAKDRQDIFFERIKHSIKYLNSVDPILGRYRFTNTYRASDRVSQYLIKNILYGEEQKEEDVFFRTLLFKFFNKIETWEALEKNIGNISWKNFNFDSYDKVLSNMLAQEERIYSAAYIMSSGKEFFNSSKKHRNHLKIIEFMMKERACEKLMRQKSLEGVFQFLGQFPCVGKFLSYQLAIDFNYSELIDFSENDFVEPGPGALDGIAKCFTDLGDYSPADIIHYMVDVQQEAFDEYVLGFQDLWGRPLHLIDCQNIFCEISKYARISHPDVQGISNRTRIKQKFVYSSKLIEAPWYPPNWDINHLIS